MSLLLALAALAAQPVPYGDLDLNRPRDVRQLDRRLRSAVRSVCGTPSDTDLAGLNQVRRCRSATGTAAAVQRDRAIQAAQATRLAARAGDQSR